MHTVFLGVAGHFDKLAEYYHENGIELLIGVYWNLCMNAAFPEQPCVHCGPHVDQKNIVGICILLVYELPNGWPHSLPLLLFSNKAFEQHTSTTP
jgi:hypothetical protein